MRAKASRDIRRAGARRGTTASACWRSAEGSTCELGVGVKLYQRLQEACLLLHALLDAEILILLVAWLIFSIPAIAIAVDAVHVLVAHVIPSSVFIIIIILPDVPPLRLAASALSGTTFARPDPADLSFFVGMDIAPVIRFG